MNRWTLSSEQFARRISISDVEGFFTRQLQIEPGVRAVIIDSGRNLGEVPAGNYVIESFTEKLQSWWNRKQCDVIIVRGEDQVLQITSPPLLTADFLQVQFRTRVSVQLRDVMIFHQKLMGSRAEYTRDQLESSIAPLLSGFIHSFVSGLTMQELRTPDTWARLDSHLADHLELYLQRYGLAFGQVLTLSIVHPEYDEQLRRRGETVLMEMAAETDRLSAKMANDAAWDRVRTEDRVQQVQAALDNLKIDREQKELEQVRRRVQIRRNLRDAVLSDKFDKLQTAADLADFVRDLDCEKLLAEDELQQLKELLEQRSEDRQANRARLLQRLAIQQRLDLQVLTDECAHVLAVRRRRAELELASIDESETDRQWRRELSKEAERAEQQRSERWKAWHDRARRFRDYWKEKRDEEVSRQAHELRYQQLQGEAELEQQQRKIRLQIMQDEQRVRTAQAKASERWIEDQYERIRQKEQADLERSLAKAAADLAHEQAERAARLQADAAAQQLSEHQVRAAQQLEAEKVTLEHERLEREQHFKRVQEADRQRRRYEEWAERRHHGRRMEEKRLEQDGRQNERRDNQAHELKLKQLENERFRDARGQSLEVLIFGSNLEMGKTLAEVAAARVRAEAEAAAAKLAAEVEQSRATAATEQARQQVAIEQARQAAAAEQARQVAELQRQRQLDDELRRKDKEILDAKDKHISSIETASDKRDASVQQMADRLLDALVSRGTPAGGPAAAAPSPGQPAVIPPAGHPAGAPTVIINQTLTPTAAGTADASAAGNVQVKAAAVGSLQMPGAEEKRCPYCHGIIPSVARFCQHCGQKQP